MKFKERTFGAGLRSGFPIFLGYVPVGFAYGILACQHGFAAWQAIAASAVALSGVGQFVALSTLAVSGSLTAALIASGIVNLRYVLFAATLSPHLQKVKLRTLAWLGFTITDESFAINMAELGEGRASIPSMSGVGVIAWIGWIIGTAIGAFGAHWVGDVTHLGLTFAMPAMYAALFIALANNKRHVACGIGAALICLGLYGLNHLGLGIPKHWFIVIGALAAATLAVVIFPPSEETLEKERQMDEEAAKEVPLS